MKRKLLNLIPVAFGFALLLAIVADLNGKWTGSIKTPDGNEISVTYNFKVDGDKLTGTAEGPEGSVNVDDGRMVKDSFYFSVTVDGNAYPHSGMVYADSCSLDVDFGSQKVHTVLTRPKN